MNRRLMFMTAPEGGEPAGGAGATGDQDKDKGATFTQADVDRIVSERVKREQAKYADYDDLKARADGAKTVEDKVADLTRELEETKREALRRRVQAAHSISDEDADLFLTGTDLDTLTAQAKRLADREADRKKTGARAPLQGRTPTNGATDDPMREFVRNLVRRD